MFGVCVWNIANIRGARLDRSVGVGGVGKIRAKQTSEGGEKKKKKEKTDTRLDRSVGVGGVGNIRAKQTCERSEKAKPSGSDAEKDIEADEFVARFVELKLQVVWCQYLYFCTRKASTLNQFVARCVKLKLQAGQQQLLMCQYLYFCTSKASKLSRETHRGE
jgi:hypothetical protein